MKTDESYRSGSFAGMGAALYAIEREGADRDVELRVRALGRLLAEEVSPVAARKAFERAYAESVKVAFDEARAGIPVACDHANAARDEK